MPLFTLGNIILANDKLLGLHKLMHTGQTAGVFSGAPASRRKHGEKPAYKIGVSFSFKISSARNEFKISSAVPER